jgi:hypothetical protein
MQDVPGSQDNRRFDYEILGKFAVYSSELELVINEIISYYFCESEDKRKTLSELILYDPHVSFEKKIGIFIAIITRLYPAHTVRNAKLFTQLGEVKSLRIDLSYSVPSPKEVSDPSGAYGMIIRYKNGEFVEEQISGKRIIDRTDDARSALIELQSILRDISKGAGQLPFKQVI